MSKVLARNKEVISTKCIDSSTQPASLGMMSPYVLFLPKKDDSHKKMIDLAIKLANRAACIASMYESTREFCAGFICKKNRAFLWKMLLKLFRLKGRMASGRMPWIRKRRLGANIGVPLKVICFLERGEENKITTVAPQDATMMLMQQSCRL